MDETGGNGHEHKIAVQVITLEQAEIYQAIVHHMLRKYGNGRVTHLEWKLTAVEGYTLPPIEDIAVECTLE